MGIQENVTFPQRLGPWISEASWEPHCQLDARKSSPFYQACTQMCHQGDCVSPKAPEGRHGQSIGSLWCSPLAAIYSLFQPIRPWSTTDHWSGEQKILIYSCRCQWMHSLDLWRRHHPYKVKGSLELQRKTIQRWKKRITWQIYEKKPSADLTENYRWKVEHRQSTSFSYYNHFPWRKNM